MISAQAQPSLQSSADAAGTGAAPSLQPAASPVRTLSDSQQIMPVEEAFSLGMVREKERLVLHWDIAEGYYLYHDKFSFSLNGSPVEPEFLTMPRMTHDEFFGETAIHRQGASIALTLERGGTLDVNYQGCAEDRYCYPPAIRQLQVTP